MSQELSDKIITYNSVRPKRSAGGITDISSEVRIGHRLVKRVLRWETPIWTSLECNVTAWGFELFLVPGTQFVILAKQWRPSTAPTSTAGCRHESSDRPLRLTLTRFDAFTCSRDSSTNNCYGVVIGDDSRTSPVYHHSRLSSDSLYIDCMWGFAFQMMGRMKSMTVALVALQFITRSTDFEGNLLPQFSG